MNIKMIKNNRRPNPQKKISVIFACFGRYSEVETYVAQTVKELLACKDTMNLIVVFDGAYWESTPLAQLLKVDFPDSCIVTVDPECSLPANLFSIGAEQVNTPFVVFAWPGCGLTGDIIRTFDKKAQHKIGKVYYLAKEQLEKFPHYPNNSYRYGWCQCNKLFELNHMMIHSEVFEKVGRLNSSRILQRYFDWDFILRLARNYDFIKIGTVKNHFRYDFENYPYSQCFNVSKDIAHRYLLRFKDDFASYSDTLNVDEINFLIDLPVGEREYVLRAINMNIHPLTKTKKAFTSGNQRNYRISIFGGYWEQHHNQVVFFNFLDKLYGKGFATYKVLLDTLATEDEVKNSDLVIFTRCRNPNILPLIDYCHAHSITTVYVIDDNWLSVGKDYPDLRGDMFRPGNPNYDTFIEALKKCKATIVNNKYLEEDIKPYANDIYTSPFNINLELYPSSEEERQDTIIGYAGSYRTENSAFEAMAEIGKNDPNIKILLCGSFSKEQEEIFKDVSVIKVPYASYFQYSSRVSAIKPLILVAPLKECRTSISKCPNKYLEISAIGAAGVYSNVYPYNEVIKDGVNGILVKKNDKEEWKQKILYLLDHRDVLETIRKNSLNDIKKKYCTDVVMEQFCQVIDKIMGRGK